MKKSIFRSKSASMKGNENFGNKMAIKIMNNYAENFKYIEKENKVLRQRLSDTKTNLQISKDIINTFVTKYSDPKLKYNNIIQSLNKQINCFQEINRKLYEDNETLNNKVNKMNLMYSTINEEIEELKTRLFILQQAIKKKDNIIKNLKNNSEIKILDKFTLIKPNVAAIKLHKELEEYKEKFKKVYKYSVNCKEKLEKYENLVTNLQTEKDNLKAKNHLQKIQADRDKENLIFKVREALTTIALNDEKSNKSFNMIKTKNNSNNALGNLNLLNSLNKSLIQKSKDICDSLIVNRTIENNCGADTSFSTNNKKNLDLKDDDFIEILRQAGVPYSEFEKMSKNPKFSKLTDVIEIMFKFIVDKTKTINIMEVEMENLNKENFELNKTNMELLKNKNIEENLLNSNANKITIKNVNINTLSNYQKILNNNNLNIQEDLNKIFTVSPTEPEFLKNSDDNKNKEIKKNKENKNQLKENNNSIVCSDECEKDKINSFFSDDENIGKI